MLKTVDVRAALHDDIDEIFVLVNSYTDTDSFMRSISMEEIKRELENFLIVTKKNVSGSYYDGDDVSSVDDVDDDDAVVFCGCGRILEYETVSEICSLSVKQGLHGGGCGQVLVEALLAKTAHRHVIVHTASKNRVFFEKCGFRNLGLAPKVYADDATPPYVMEALADCATCMKFDGLCPELIMLYVK